LSIPTTHRLPLGKLALAFTLALALALPLVTACAPAGAGTESAGSAPAPAPVSPGVLEAAARADSVRSHYTQADVDFMTGMLHHHAQALVMARMAPTHDASPALRTLAARIINSQRDEIALMSRWLRERDEPVPELHIGGGHGDHVGHGGHQQAHAAAMPHGAPMHGMLTAEQLQRLDEARDAEWDRFFLTYMIQHHKGAVVMVDRLFDTHGAGQGDAIFKIAADIGADQASEIDRMQRMLRDLVFDPGTDTDAVQ